MKKLYSYSSRVTALAAVAFLAATWAVSADVTMELDQDKIGVGDSAQLTVRSSGTGGEPISPPTVAGLQFTPVNQSSEIQIINGAMTATTSVTYEVTAQAPGTYTIPAVGTGTKPLTLQVSGSGVAQNSAPAAPAAPSPGLPAPAMANPPAGTPQHMMADGNAFVRMDLPKRDLYVGETVPVDIQVGLRAGLAATLEGLPSLSADAFTLNKLTTKPEETQEAINGQAFTILTWHSSLAAIKPGEFSLDVETPVMVEYRTRPRGLPMDDNSPFDSSFFQNFFGTVTKKELTLANDPAPVKVLPLPTTGQPGGFTGAVGKFTATSELSATTATAGDPLTLKLKIQGEGSFDRVESPMLGTVTGWKTYHPTTKLVPADGVGYSGEKDFEQAVIPMQAGHLTLPAISFSYFNPESRQYETTTAAPVSIDVSPLAGEPVPAPAPVASAAGNNTPASTPAVAAIPADGLQADRVDRGVSFTSLRPLYFQPAFLFSQALLAFGFLGSWFWLRRHESTANDRLKHREEWQNVDACLKQMKEAAARRDTGTFFLSARAALQYALALRWNLPPQAITEAEIEARLNGSSENIRQVFALADEIAYSGQQPASADFKAWETTVREVIKERETV